MKELSIFSPLFFLFNEIHLSEKIIIPEWIFFSYKYAECESAVYVEVMMS